MLFLHFLYKLSKYSFTLWTITSLVLNTQKTQASNKIFHNIREDIWLEGVPKRGPVISIDSYSVCNIHLIILLYNIWKFNSTFRSAMRKFQTRMECGQLVITKIKQGKKTTRKKDHKVQFKTRPNLTRRTDARAWIWF